MKEITQMPVINKRLTRQAIFTKFISPTNTRGPRIRAWCEGGSIIVSLDHALGIEESHAAAAEALMRKLDRNWNYVMGGHPDGNGYVFVEVPEV